MIRLEHVYLLAGLMFAGFALSHTRDRGNPARWRSALFWSLYALEFVAGSRLPDLVNGLIVLALVALALAGLKPGRIATTDAAAREASAQRLGTKLFLPALLVPALTIAATLLLGDGKLGGRQWIEPGRVTVVALGLAAIVGYLLAVRLSRPAPAAMFDEGRRLADAVGWAMLLPQLLAALGALFALAGAGEAVSQLIAAVVPIHHAWTAATVYCVGMALFTVLMGNAFAAFPVMTAGIGLPLVVRRFGGDPAAVCALGMLSGFCGTLMTPMAANFNIVPVAVLELPDRYQVIKTQLPTALILLLANIVLMMLFGF
ncbi:MAG: DUF979 domain-containing protein [Pseudoxanthomonas sp.]